jgi:putative Holliday junction resolvase
LDFYILFVYKMRCIGIDYGTKRIGLASGDELGVATPLPAVLEADPVRRMERLAEVLRQRRPQCLVVGYPVNMDGSIGSRAREVDAFLDQLGDLFPGVRLEKVDERLTSRAASAHLSLKEERRLRASGKIDSAAAALILQDFLDREFPVVLPGPEVLDEP